MDVSVRLLNTLLPMLYLATVTGYVVDFVRGVPEAVRAARRLLEVTLVCHVGYLVLRAVHEGHVPLSSAPELLSMVAFATSAVYIVVERFTGVERTGAFMVLIPLVLQTASSAFITDHYAFPAVLRSPLFAVHTLAAVIGYVALGVSAVYGVLFLMLHHELKSDRFGVFFDRLPPLETMARMNRRAAGIGVTFLAITIACGALWASREFPGFFRDPKFLITVVVWIVFLAAPVLQYARRWSSRRTVGISLVGFVLLLLSLLITQLIPTFHAFL